MKSLSVCVGCLLFWASIVGCSDMLLVSGNSDEEAITFANVQTKAVVSSADEVLSMGVLAQMNLGSDENDPGYDDYIMLLDNEHVQRTGPDAPWTYENTRYWVPGTESVFRHFKSVMKYFM